MNLAFRNKQNLPNIQATMKTALRVISKAMIPKSNYLPHTATLKL